LESLRPRRDQVPPERSPGPMVLHGPPHGVVTTVFSDIPPSSRLFFVSVSWLGVCARFGHPAHLEFSAAPYRAPAEVMPHVWRSRQEPGPPFLSLSPTNQPLCLLKTKTRRRLG